MPEAREGLGAGGATGDRKPWRRQPARRHFTAVKILFKISLYVLLLKYYQNQFLNSIGEIILACCKEKEKCPALHPMNQSQMLDGQDHTCSSEAAGKLVSAGHSERRA